MSTISLSTWQSWKTNKALTYESKLRAMTVPWAWQTLSIKHCFRLPFNGLCQGMEPSRNLWTSMLQLLHYTTNSVDERCSLENKPVQSVFWISTDIPHAIRFRNTCCHQWSYNLAETVSNLLQREVGDVLHTSVGMAHGFYATAVLLCDILILNGEKHTPGQVYP